MFFALLLAAGGTLFGSQYYGSDEASERRRNEAAAMLFNNMGFEGLGLYNFFAHILRFFGADVPVFDVNSNTGNRSIFEFPRNLEEEASEMRVEAAALEQQGDTQGAERLVNRANRLDNTAGNAREQMADQLHSDLSLPESLATAIANNDAALTELQQVLVAAEISITDLQLLGNNRDNIFSVAALTELLTDSPTIMTLLAESDLVPDAVQEAFLNANFNDPVFLQTLSANLKTADGNEIANVLSDTLRVYVMGNMSDEERGEVAVSVLSDPEELSSLLTEAGLSGEAHATALAFFARNTENLENIFGAEDIGVLTTILTNEPELLADIAANPQNFLMQILEREEFASIKESLMARIIAGNQVEEALGQMDYSMLEPQQRDFAQFISAVLSRQSNGEASNLDLIAQNQELAVGLLGALGGEEFSITSGQRASINNLVSQIDFEDAFYNANLENYDSQSSIYATIQEAQSQLRAAAEEAGADFDPREYSIVDGQMQFLVNLATGQMVSDETAQQR